MSTDPQVVIVIRCCDTAAASYKSVLVASILCAGYTGVLFLVFSMFAILFQV